jgi:ketosteroid isomerase-like protein
MRTTIAFGLLALALTSAYADEPKPHGNLDAARAIVKADHDFGELAKKEGTAKAFRDSMDADEGVVYGGGSEPAVGHDAIYATMGGDAPDESTLVWHPIEAFAAKSGDMGVTRGRWTATSKADPSKSFGGAYVTVWRKNAKGEWKGLVDIGNPDKPKTPPKQ